MESSKFINRCAQLAGINEPESKGLRMMMYQYPTFRWEFTSEDKSFTQSVVIEEQPEVADAILKELSTLLGKEYKYGTERYFNGLIPEVDADTYDTQMDMVYLIPTADNRIYASFGYSKYYKDEDVNLISLIGKPYLDGTDTPNEPTEICIAQYNSKVQIAYEDNSERYRNSTCVNLSHSGKSTKVFKEIIENFNAVFNEDLTVSKSSGLRSKDPNKFSYNAYISEDQISVYYTVYLEDK